MMEYQETKRRSMDFTRTIVTICMMILVVVGPTTMASRPFPLDVHPDKVCCPPGSPCCNVSFPHGPEEDDFNVNTVAPSPSPSMDHAKMAHP